MDGIAVRAIRIFYSMTQQTFATHLGVSLSAIKAVETNQRRVSENMRFRIAQAFDLNPDVLEAIRRAKASSKIE